MDNFNHAQGAQEFWEVEGTVTRKKGLFGRVSRNFRYQINPDTGDIVGYEEITPVK